MTLATSTQATPLLRRLACIAYDSLLLIAVFFFSTLPLVMLSGQQVDSGNPFFTLYLLVISCLYFSWCWTHGGQTLGMKTWKVTLFSDSGDRIRSGQAITRFLLALLGMILVGIGFWWAFFDRDKRTLHDRWSGSYLRHEVKDVS